LSRKRSFTSAVKDRAGKFEAADKGTIFLDEIDMSLLKPKFCVLCKKI
jgi:transcriptional regulator with GAF, ATPase, and Fis domain